MLDKSKIKDGKYVGRQRQMNAHTDPNECASPLGIYLIVPNKKEPEFFSCFKCSRCCCCLGVSNAELAVTNEYANVVGPRQNGPKIGKSSKQNKTRRPGKKTHAYLMGRRKVSGAPHSLSSPACL